MKANTLLLRIVLLLLIPILFLYGIITAKEFLFPLFLALLFAYLLYPIVNFLDNKGFPRAISILLSILLALSVIGGIILVFYSQLNLLLEDYDAIKQQATENIEAFERTIIDTFGLKGNRIDGFLEAQVDTFFSSEGRGINRLFSATTGTISKLFLLPVYVFLFLFFRTKFAKFILKVVNENKRSEAVNTLRDISTVAARYMGGVTIVVLILCVLNSTGLSIIGVEYAILLGITSAFFNFIPYFGTLMGGAVPLLFVLLSSEQPLATGIQVVILFIIVQVTENNILTPMIVGGNVNINPFFVIVGLVAGAMVWGIAGMVVVIPMLAMARIIMSNSKKVHPFAYLLGPRRSSRTSIVKRLKGVFSQKKNG
ncbi:MAG: AI-2E family transporter [Bacteroidales bacterium]|nr:AI-2E family transporter [Bacteroidales bacterium]